MLAILQGTHPDVEQSFFERVQAEIGRRRQELGRRRLPFRYEEMRFVPIALVALIGSIILAVSRAALSQPISRAKSRDVRFRQ